MRSHFSLTRVIVPWQAILGTLLATFLACLYASEIGMTQNGVVALWPAAGITLWACWRWGLWAAGASFVGYYLYSFCMPLDNAIESAGNALGAYAGALLLRRKLDPYKGLAVTNLLLITGPAAILLSAISAAIGAPTLAWRLDLPSEAVPVLTLRWFLSDFAGTVVTAPFLFALSTLPNPGWRTIILSREMAVAMTLSLILMVTLSADMETLSVSATVLLVSTPFIGWLAVRQSPLRVALSLSVIGISALTLAAQLLNNDNRALLETQLFVITFLGAAMVMQGLINSLRVANQHLGEKRANLEAAVKERTRDLEQAMLRAEAADRAKSEFLANTSHEVRTPLNAILGMAEFLKESRLDPKQQEQVSTILTSGWNLMSLLNDIIDLSKVEAGRLELLREPLELKRLLQELNDLWAPSAQEKGLYFRIERAGDLASGYQLDTLRVKQCLANLLSNAIKFTERGGVTLAIGPAQAPGGPGLSLRVSDTGIGMNAAGLARALVPFEQADASISRAYGGTGLGLSITRKLAQLMGGDVTLTSEPDVGTQVTVTIAAEAVTVEVAEDTSPPAQRNLAVAGLRTLIVEDNPVNRLVLKGHLKKLDLAFDEAGKRGAMPREAGCRALRPGAHGRAHARHGRAGGRSAHPGPAKSPGRESRSSRSRQMQWPTTASICWRRAWTATHQNRSNGMRSSTRSIAFSKRKQAQANTSTQGAAAPPEHARNVPQVPASPRHRSC